ncbi:RNA_polymerase II subunit Rpb5b [Hexamita inflata]|uniref:RNA polymerase II subunit Rpb5b n=1 Tax=Hexamita inflata TaxID=28002 RepID=A0AA86Q639_9EUKA|nr:RNA polymerase II subunit Rpb5b [Hexamita inflata]
MQSIQEKLVTAVGNLVDMLEYRGIDVSELAPLRALTVDDVQKELTPEYLKSLTIQLPAVAVYFAVDFARDTVTELKDTTIVVCLQKPKPSALVNKTAQVFHVDELLINITKNALVPQHERVSSKDEIKRILAQLMAEFTQLPVIFENDAMAKYIGSKSGELVRVIRKSKQAGEFVVYRAVM